MGKLLVLKQKLSSYSRELLYVLRNSIDSDTRATLIKNTALFHLSNAAGKRPNRGSPVLIRLRLGANCQAEIAVRPFTGDLFVLFEVLMEQCYFIPEAALSREGVHVILDCGANIGITAIFMACRYPNARIFSIEPNDENFALLTRNTIAEPRIVPIRGAIVGYPRRTVRLSTSEPAWGNFITDQAEGLEVPAFTVEQICENYGLPRVDLLKVDIEGAEREVFANGRFMERVGVMIVELHDEYDTAHFASDVAEWGFVVSTAGHLPGLKMIIAHRVAQTFQPQ
jgi:FkbM family methyltransferase